MRANANISTKHHLFLDADDSEKENSGFILDGSIISLEFASRTKGIKISNIPPDRSLDDIKLRFSNLIIGGGKVTDIMLDRNNGAANVYFEKFSGWIIAYSNWQRKGVSVVVLIF